MQNGREFPKALEAASLLGIVLLAASLRFASLPSRGLIYWDEAKFALEGIRVQAGLLVLVGERVGAEAGKAIGTAKPMHALLIALAYAAVGSHDYAPLLVNATSSVLQVVILYLLGRVLFGPATALVGALLLAVSEYDIVYARSALSESDGNLFFLLGTLFLVRSLAGGGKRIARTSFLAGLLMGVAFTVNYRLIVYIGVICLAALLAVWRDSRQFPWRGFLFIPAFTVLPLAWQVMGIVARGHGFSLFNDELTGRPTTYLAEVVYQIHEGKQAAIHFTPLIYLQWYVLRQGWLASLLLVGGLVQAGRLRSWPWLIPAALVIFPYVVYVFAPFNVPRNLVAALPFTSLLAAAALVSMASAFPFATWRRPIGLAACVLLAIAGGMLSWRLTAVRSGFAAAAGYLHAHGGRAVTTTELMVYYLRNPMIPCAAPAMPVSKRALSAAIANGYRYAVAERHGTPLTLYVDTRAPVVARFLALGHVHLGESLISSENGDPPRAGSRPEYVRVYWLPGLHLPPADRAPTRCQPNRVV